MFRAARHVSMLVLLTVLPGLAWAGGHGRDRDQAPPAAPAPAPAKPAPSAPSTTLPDSVRRVERKTGGEVLRAEPMQRDGHEVYRIKVLTADGRVRVMQEDPEKRDDGRRRDRDKTQDPPADGGASPPPPALG